MSIIRAQRRDACEHSAYWSYPLSRWYSCPWLCLSYPSRSSSYFCHPSGTDRVNLPEVGDRRDPEGRPRGRTFQCGNSPRVPGTGVHRRHICPGTGLHPRPRLRRDWAHSTHICPGTGLTPAYVCAGTDWAHSTVAHDCRTHPHLLHDPLPPRSPSLPSLLRTHALIR
jgi:hypothetical protein